ncbi:MAG: pantetheine-phosphate adenylyltransferase [Bacteroidetes bacterium]|nr:pantetheine-phosphate adenylyltransferase [Bacteroidales bacterium]MBU1009656.1 pantetheine-phosphate adenylyltransferase [Bacteroidota bacterium]
MKKIAVFPGSFDPITLGHESLVLRALPLFDEIIIAVGINALKSYYFPVEKRIDWIKKVFADYPQISVTSYEGLTVDFCRAVGSVYILRGLRTSADFEFERSIGQVNKKLFPEVETVFLLTTPELTAITSSVIRDVVRNGGDASQFVPPVVDLTI